MTIRTHIRVQKDPRDAYALQYLSFVTARVKRRWSRHPDLDDIVQESALALVMAARYYVPDGRASFSTYLWRSGAFHGATRHFKFKCRGYAQVGAPLPIPEDSPEPEGDDRLQVADDAATSEECVLWADNLRVLGDRVNMLLRQYRTFLLLYYQDDEDVTYRTVAHARGVSRERARQVVGGALHHLRAQAKDDLFCAEEPRHAPYAHELLEAGLLPSVMENRVWPHR